MTKSSRLGQPWPSILDDPKMFGGDVAKAIESFQKSLAFDTSQDETWAWLPKPFKNKGYE